MEHFITWRRRGEDMAFSVSSVVEVIKELAGAAGIELAEEPTLVNTGGGCGAIEVKTKDDRYIVVTDGDVLAYYDDEWQVFYEGWTVGVYGVDPDGGGWTEEALSFHTVEGAGDESLAEAFNTAVRSDAMSTLVTRLAEASVVIENDSRYKDLERAGLVDDITTAIEMIRTHALPPEHPLAIN